MTKVLIIQTAFIGDVVLATSLIELTRKTFPQAQIDFLLRKGNESLLADNPQITNLYVWNKQQKLRSFWTLLKSIRREHYDYCLNIQRFFFSGLFTALSKSRQTVMFDKNPMSWFASHSVPHRIPHPGLHEVQRNAQLLQKVSGISIEADPKLLPLKVYIKPELELSIKQWQTESYLVLAPASVWFTKQFPADQWKQLVQQLDAYKLLFIGAPSDREFIDDIIGDHAHCENLAGKLSLLQSAALMKNAKRVFVNDSAPLHLASAVDAKTTGIFCSTIAAFGYTPLASDSHVVETPKALQCRPCGLHGRAACPLGHFDCAYSISIQELVNTI